MDRDLEAAFRRVEELLFGGPSRPGLTRRGLFAASHALGSQLDALLSG